MGAKTLECCPKVTTCWMLHWIFNILRRARERSNGVNCHGRWNYGSVPWSPVQKGIDGVATSWITTAKRKQRRHNPEKRSWPRFSGIVREFCQLTSKSEILPSLGGYYAFLIYKLKDAIKEKRRGKLSRGVRLLHDNVPVHTSVAAKATIQCCGFQELNEPPYSPNLAPSDYFCFQNWSRICVEKNLQVMKKSSPQC
jgi:histone-lysine N-methyltransferase SETMAR